MQESEKAKHEQPVNPLYVIIAFYFVFLIKMFPKLILALCALELSWRKVLFAHFISFIIKFISAQKLASAFKLSKPISLEWNLEGVNLAVKNTYSFFCHRD